MPMIFFIPSLTDFTDWSTSSAEHFKWQGTEPDEIDTGIGAVSCVFVNVL